MSLHMWLPYRNTLQCYNADPIDESTKTLLTMIRCTGRPCCCPGSCPTSNWNRERSSSSRCVSHFFLWYSRQIRRLQKDFSDTNLHSKQYACSVNVLTPFSHLESLMVASSIAEVIYSLASFNKLEAKFRGRTAAYLPLDLAW
jgi:hypothetical protein